MVNVIDESLEHFSTARTTAPRELTEHYDYLLAYWTIAKILLPDASEIEDRVTALRDEFGRGNDFFKNGTEDLTDEALGTFIRERSDEILAQYPTQYDDAVMASLDMILA